KAFSIKNGREQPTFQKKALDTLMHYSWPGNVRELQNLMERLVILCIDDQVTFEDLPDNILSPTSSIEGVGSIQFNEALVDLKFKDAKQEIVTTFERQYLSALLKKHNGNISSAARHAGIDRRTIHRLINELDLPLRKNTVI
ncbi:MAG: sigma-54-dependent Fis family transcriptional regulator, partial [Lentisphaeria bacterium]|nr:sigma-54-dependent Fis family transcriptional regulator [Lentisphaeria bacterium]